MARGGGGTGAGAQPARQAGREARRLADQRQALGAEGDPAIAVAAARDAAQAAAARREELRAVLEAERARKDELASARDDAASALATARADLSGVEREWQALDRDRQARARQAQGKHGLPVALDGLAAEPGYERALAAVLGRDARPRWAPDKAAEGRFWTGAATPAPVADSLAAHVSKCPPELAARLALVHVADADDGRALGPGEWLVTRDGLLRRWDGFVARGEGAAEAARLEADNRFADLEARFPPCAMRCPRRNPRMTGWQQRQRPATRPCRQRARRERSRRGRAAGPAQPRSGRSRRERLAARAGEIDAAERGLADQRKLAEAR
jgi:chromosome segregation protein